MNEHSPADASLTAMEREALAAWADEHEATDGFADAVLAAWEQEQGEDHERLGHERLEAVTRPATSRGTLGLVAGLAAAAAVLLLMQVLPRPVPGDAAELVAQAEREDLAELRPDQALYLPSEQAGAVLALRCSPCHDSADAAARGEAIEVFDVREREWWPSMSDEQLEAARARLEASAATDEERARFSAFIDDTLAHRAG